MANEMSVTAKVTASKGNFKLTRDIGVVQIDMTSGNGGTPGVVNATTASANVSFGAVSPHVVWIRNLSTGTNVTFETTAGDSFLKLEPGDVNICSKSTDTTWKVKTASGTANVDISSFAQ